MILCLRTEVTCQLQKLDHRITSFYGIDQLFAKFHLLEDFTRELDKVRLHRKVFPHEAYMLSVRSVSLGSRYFSPAPVGKPSSSPEVLVNGYSEPEW